MTKKGEKNPPMKTSKKSERAWDVNGESLSAQQYNKQTEKLNTSDKDDDDLQSSQKGNGCISSQCQVCALMCVLHVKHTADRDHHWILLWLTAGHKGQIEESGVSLIAPLFAFQILMNSHLGTKKVLVGNSSVIGNYFKHLA